MPSVKVDIIGDSSSLQKAYRSAATSSKTFGKSVTDTHGAVGTLEKGVTSGASALSTFAKSAVLAGGALIGVGSLYEGIKKTVGAAEDFNQAQRQMKAQLDANGESFRAVAPWVAKLNASQVQLGFTSTQTERAFTQLDRASGSAATAYKYMAVTADLAAARHIDLNKAALVVGKVIDGNIGILNRYGVAVAKGTTAADALEQAQRKLHGQALASVTPFEKFHAVLNNIEVEIGQVLLPIVTKYLNKITDWLSQTRNQTKITDAVKTAIHDMGAAIEVAKGIIQAMLPYVQKAVDLFKEFAKQVGGAKNAIIILGSAFAAWKLASTIAGIGAEAERTGGLVRLLTRNLRALSLIGAIAIPIAIILERDQIDKAITGFLDKHGLPGGTNVGDLTTAAGRAKIAGTFGQGLVDQATKATTSGGNLFGPAGGKAATSATTAGSLSAGKAKLLAFAKSAIGTPYLWGGAGPGGFDCSGIVQWAFANGLNISIPRTTYGQAATGRLVGTNTLKGAKPGDVIFTQYGEGGKAGPGHEGLYLGGGQVLSAPHTGAKVGISSISGFTGGGTYTVRDLAAVAGASAAAALSTGTTPLGPATLPDMSPVGAAAKKKKGRKISLPDLISGAGPSSGMFRFLPADIGGEGRLTTGMGMFSQGLQASIGRQGGLSSANLETLKKAREQLVALQHSWIGGALSVPIANEMGKVDKAINSINFAKSKAAWQRHIDALKAIATQAKAGFVRAFGDLATSALNAFDRATQQGMSALESQRSALTPAEQALQDLQDTHQQAALQAQLAADQAAGDSKAVQEDLYQIQVDALQKQANVERKAQDDSFRSQEQDYQDQRDAQRSAFETQLKDLQDQLLAKHTAIGSANDQILKLMSQFGLDPTWFTSGQNAGSALISGLAAAFKAADQQLQQANDTASAASVAQDSGPAAQVAGGAAAYYQPTAITTPGAGTYKYKPMLQSGGFITKSGLAYLHRGENVIPAGGGGAKQINFHFPNYVGSQQELAYMLRAELAKIGRREPNVFGGLA